MTSYYKELTSAKEGEQKILEMIIKSSVDYIILFNFENWSYENWRKLEAYRSCLDRKKKGGLLVLNNNAVKQLLSHAPSFSSWLGPRIYQLNTEAEFLNDEQIKKRLEALQEWSGLTNDEVIEMAKTSKIPSDPEYGEWLVLLDREDLIQR